MRALGFLLAVLALLAVACGGEESTQGTTTTTTASETAPPDRGKMRPKAPPVAGTTLDAESLALDDFRGRPVLVNVWSAW